MSSVPDLNAVDVNANSEDRMKHLETFRDSHCLNGAAQLGAIEVAVDCVSEANNIGYNFLANIDNRTRNDGFVVLAHINLMGRIFEHAGGMLACIATQCPTSSEALGRIVVEGSVNLMHMSQFGREKAIIAFFESWINEHDGKLNRWKNIVRDKEGSMQVVAQIDERIGLVDHYREFTNQLVKDLCIDKTDQSSAWPKSLFDRFKNLDREEYYYTHYHRLSGSSHITAEDTISWLRSLDFDDKQKHALALEAVSYSIMMARLASLFFVDAVAICCICHGLTPGTELNRFTELKKRIVISIDEIAKSAGVPEIKK